MRRFCGWTVLLLGSLCPGNAQSIHAGWKARASEPVAGPAGLSGWTLDYLLPEEFAQSKDEYEPMTLLIARKGHQILSIEGEPFVWEWKFWNKGRQVAVERGPKHFGLTCSLFDVKTGRELQRIDCYSELPKDAPAWVLAVAR